MDITVDIRDSLKRAKSLLQAPKVFFAAIKKEKGWQKAFSYSLVVAAVGHILTAIYNVLVTANGADLPFGPQEVVVAVLVSFIITLGMSFIWGGALKVWLSVFKVESTFAQSYRVMVYSRTPNYLFSWVPFLGFVAALYSFYLMMLALEKEYEVTRKKAIIIIVTSMVVLFVASLLLVSLIPNV
jgi:hypothetical protein